MCINSWYTAAVSSFLTKDKSACLLAPLCPNEELELGVGRMKLQELVHRGDEHVAEYQVLRP